MSNNQQVVTFKKSLVSIVVVSVVTGGLIAWEKSQAVVQLPVTNVVNQAIISSIAPSNSAQVNADFEQQLTRAASREQNTQESLSSVAMPIVAEAQLASDQQQTSNSETQSQLAIAATETEPQAVVANEQTQPIITAPAATQLTEEPPELEQKLLFAFDSYQVKPSYYPALTAIATELGKDKSKQQVWQVVGYADPSGNALYNRKLAQKRAQAVAHFLIAKGVAAAQLQVVSLGASQAKQTASAAPMLQRRVEIHPYQADISALAAQLTASQPLVVADQQSLAAPVIQNNPAPQHETRTLSLDSALVTPLTTAMEF